VVSFFLALTLWAYSLWESQQVYQTAASANYTAFRPDEDSELSFDELRAVNPEVIAWLTVNGTPIDYPVTQAPNNEKYINTDVMGNFTLSGAIFLDYRNSPSFEDFCSVVYGHHMEKKLMFGALSDFAEQDYLDGHPYGNLFFDGKDHGLEFFALILTDAYDKDLYLFALDEQEERQAYLETIRSKALTQRPIELGTEDHLVMLSTCTSQITNGRYLLIGKITEELHPQENRASAHRPLESGTDKAELRGVNSVPVWVWAGMLAGLLALLYTMKCRPERQGRKG